MQINEESQSIKALSPRIRRIYYSVFLFSLKQRKQSIQPIEGSKAY